MFEMIKKRLKHTDAYPYLLSVLQHCLQMPCEYIVFIDLMLPAQFNQFLQLLYSLVLLGNNIQVCLYNVILPKCRGENTDFNTRHKIQLHWNLNLF